MIAILASLLIENLENIHIYKISEPLLYLTVKQTYELRNIDPTLQLKITRL